VVISLAGSAGRASLPSERKLLLRPSEPVDYKQSEL
jgi:hypothetical protein